MSDFKMPNINNVALAGRLTRDPELRYTPNGTAVCDLSLAVDGRNNEASFFNITCFNKAAEFVTENAEKGRAVYIEGRLEQDRWESSEGQKRSKVKVIAFKAQTMEWRDASPATGARGPVAEDDIPF